MNPREVLRCAIEKVVAAHPNPAAVLKPLIQELVAALDATKPCGARAPGFFPDDTCVLTGPHDTHSAYPASPVRWSADYYRHDGTPNSNARRGKINERTGEAPGREPVPPGSAPQDL